MNRRDFLKDMAAVGALAAFPLSLGMKAQPKTQHIYMKEGERFIGLTFDKPTMIHVASDCIVANNVIRGSQEGIAITVPHGVERWIVYGNIIHGINSGIDLA